MRPTHVVPWWRALRAVSLFPAGARNAAFSAARELIRDLLRDGTTTGIAGHAGARDRPPAGRSWLPPRLPGSGRRRSFGEPVGRRRCAACGTDDVAIDGWIAVDRHLLCGDCSWAAVSGALLHGRVVAPYRGRVGSPRRTLAEAYQSVVDFKERRGEWMACALPLARALAWSIRELCVDVPGHDALLPSAHWAGTPPAWHGFSSRVSRQQSGATRTPLVVPVPSYRGRRPHVRLLTALAAIRVPAVRVGLDVLAKTRDFTQKGLARSERRAESEGAYVVHPYWRPFLRARRVIVADDLVTTGATLEACTRALLAAGADLVEGAAVVRVIRAPPERIISLGSRQARVQLRELDSRGRAPILAGPGLFWVICPCTAPCPRTVVAGPYRVPALDAVAAHRWLCGCGATHCIRARREWQSGVRDLLAVGIDGRRSPELLVGVVQGTPVWVT